jgi:hypothetical protein
MVLSPSRPPPLATAYGFRSRHPRDSVVCCYLCNILSWQYDELSHLALGCVRMGNELQHPRWQAFLEDANCDYLALDCWAALLICVHQ